MKKTCRDVSHCGGDDHAKTRDWDGWADYRTARRIGFVRHPVEWVTTCYNAHKGWKAWGIAEKDIDDAEFAERCFTPYDWFTDTYGRLIFDEIWRAEDMDRFFRAIGVTKPVPRLNVTKERRTNSRRRPLSKAAVEIVHNRFEREWKFYSNDAKRDELQQEVIRSGNQEAFQHAQTHHP